MNEKELTQLLINFDECIKLSSNEHEFGILRKDYSLLSNHILSQMKKELK